MPILPSSSQNSSPVAPAASSKSAPTTRPPALQQTPPAQAVASSHVDQSRISNQAGRAVTQVALGASSPQAQPIRLLGLRQGDSLEVDGTLTADGTATVKTLNDNEFELQTSINIPSVARGFADDEFKLVGGKVNLSIKLKRDGDKYRYSLVDNHSGKTKGSGSSELKVTEGSKSESGLFGGKTTYKTQSLQISTDQGNLTIKLKQDPKGGLTGSVTIPGLPGIVSTFDLEKQ